MQLQDQQLAEDAVQEAMLGALKNMKSFGGRAAFKTWVFAILKHKISDVLRYKQRFVEARRLLHEDEEEEDYHELFDQRGHWLAEERPQAWNHPEETLKVAQFWRIFEVCLENLPAKQGRVFMMREFIELETQEICATVGVSISNLNTMLHRARIRLRECLENRWFLQDERAEC